jgi:hypothetical protein
MKDLKKIELFFNNRKLPKENILLSQGVTIVDCYLFVSSHLSTCKYNEGNKTYLPYYLC